MLYLIFSLWWLANSRQAPKQVEFKPIDVKPIPVVFGRMKATNV